MTLLDRVNLFLLLFLDTFRQFRRWRIWLPLLGFFFINWIFLYAHYDFLSPFFYGVIRAWASIFGEAQARAFAHYPYHYFLLSGLFGWAKLVVGILLEAAVLGIVARQFGWIFFGGDSSRWHRKSLPASRYFHLIIIWVVLNSLTIAVGTFLPDLVAPLLTGPRRQLAFFLGVLPLMFTVICSLFYYAIPSVVIFNDNALAAIGRSLSIFVRFPLTSFFLAAFVLVVPIFISSLSGHPVVIIDRFNPELVYWLLVGGLFIETVANFLWMGTAVRFLAELE